MKEETAEQKFLRLQRYIQGLVLKAYPNPSRTGCRGSNAIGEYAKRAGEFFDDVESEAGYQHILHCSPCYAEFLKARQDLRAAVGPQQAMRIPRRLEKKMARTVDQLEEVINAVANERRPSAFGEIDSR
jgi:hypothetical protein